MKPSSRIRCSTTWLRSQRAVEVRPRRQRRRRAGQPGDQRRTRRSVSVLRRLPEQILRHRLDAVDAGAQIDAIQVQLEDLLLRELLLEQQREDRLRALRAGVFLFERKSVRASCCVSVLPPSTAARRPDVAARRRGRARSDRCRDGGRTGDPRPRRRRCADPSGISASGTSRRCSSIRNQRDAVRGREPRVADAAPQLVDRPALPHRPRHGDRGEHDEQAEERGRDAIAQPPWHGDRTRSRATTARGRAGPGRARCNRREKPATRSAAARGGDRAASR